MKRVLWIALLAAGVWLLPRLSHPAVDLGKLEPVETVLLTAEEDGIRIETDTDAEGFGATLAEAIEDLQQGTGANVYLDTTNKLLIKGEMEDYWGEILEFFRPSCHVYGVQEKVDLMEVTEYLSVHKGTITLNRIRAGEVAWVILEMKEGRGRLVGE